MSVLKASRSLISQSNFLLRSSSALQKCNKSNIYEADYLTAYEPDIPIYDSLNIQLKSYDYSILEKYQKHVHKISNALKINVDENWATPAQKFKVQKFKTGTTIESEYDLTVYERNVQICDVPSTAYSTLLRILQETLPEGVSMQVHESMEAHQEVRYVPDDQLLTLKQQLDDMGGIREKKTKR